MAIMACIGLPLVSPACGPGLPPDYSVALPQVVAEGEGQVVVVYQVSEGRGPVTYVQRLGPDGARLWGEKGVRIDKREPESIATRSVLHATPRVVGDEAGNVTIFWSFKGQIYARKLDGAGKPLWQSEPVAVGTYDIPGLDTATRWTLANNATGTTIVWTDEHWDLHVQSVDKDGNLLWTTQPLQVDANELEAHRDGQGNTWLLWAEKPSGSIYLQVLDPAGREVWAEPHELQRDAVPSRERWDRCTLWLAENGPGLMVAAWQRLSDIGDRPLAMRVVSIDGEVRSGIGESFFTGRLATLPKPAGDGTQGLVALWTTNDSILAQRIDTQGMPAWRREAVVASGLPNGQVRFSASNGEADGTVVSWEAPSPTGTVWRAQRIDAQGTLLWPGGVDITSATTWSWRWQWSATVGDGSAILSGVVSYHVDRQSHVQRIAADGSLPWGADGVRLDDWRED